MKHKFLLSLFILVASFSSIGYSQDFWESMNGPYYSIIVSSIATYSSGVIYITENGGLYKSVDSGKNFIPISIGKNIVHQSVVDNHGHIFAATSDYLFRSTDEGANWELFSPSGKILNSDSSLFIWRDQRIFLSEDDGNNWSILSDPPLDRIFTINIGENNKLFVSGHLESNDGWIPATVRSEDKGQSWIPLNLPETIHNFVHADKNIVVLSASGIFISSDNGNSWTRIDSEFIPRTSIMYDNFSNCFFGTILNFSTEKVDLCKSTDMGKTWQKVGEVFEKISSCFLASNQQGLLFAGGDLGFKWSSDQGLSWNRTDKPFFALGIRNLTLLDETLIASNISGNFHYSENEGIWSIDTIPGGSFIISKSGNYFASNGKLYKSADSGETWIKVLDPESLGYGTLSGTQKLLVLSNGYIFCSGVSGNGLHDSGAIIIWCSKDDGNTWEVVYEKKPEGYFSTLAATSEDIILYGGTINGIIRSTDYGATWAESNGELPDGAKVNDIQVSRDGFIYASTSGNGLYRSGDNGSTWQPVNNGLNSNVVNSISINSNGDVFIGTPVGVYKSTDTGNNWSSKNAVLLTFQ